MMRLLRQLTSPLRGLPTFLILGAQKSGTTSLYAALAAHPDVLPSSRKEVHYFDNHYHRGLLWYRSHFPLRFYQTWLGWMRGRTIHSLEASPYYLFEPRVAARVAQCLPDMRGIVLLRNPIERAYSHYQHEVRAGREPLSFEEALQAEEIRLKEEEQKLLADSRYISPTYGRYSYLARGLYADQLQRWYGCFARSQILVMQSESLFADPEAALEQITTFLDLRPWKPGTFPKRNTNTYAPIKPEMRARLLAWFEPHNRRLYDLLDTDFGWQ